VTERQEGQNGRESTVLGRRMGGELLTLRTAAGMTQGRAAQALTASTGKIAKIEGGWVPVRDPDIRALCDLYGVEDPKITGGLLELARIDRERRKAKGWWNDFANLGDMREYVSLESAATALRAWQLSFIPGLLQTPAYIRALVRGGSPRPRPDSGDQLIASRLARQTRLTGNAPLRLWAVIHECALLHRVGGDDVMREQLTHLALASQKPNITVQVLPFARGEHAGMDGAFNIMSFAEPGAMDVAYVEIPFTRLWVEGGEVVAQYDELFATLAGRALPESESATFIEAITKGL
jgi:hypothetical protein